MDFPCTVRANGSTLHELHLLTIVIRHLPRLIGSGDHARGDQHDRICA